MIDPMVNVVAPTLSSGLSAGTGTLGTGETESGAGFGDVLGVMLAASGMAGPPDAADVTLSTLGTEVATDTELLAAPGTALPETAVPETASDGQAAVPPSDIPAAGGTTKAGGPGTKGLPAVALAGKAASAAWHASAQAQLQVQKGESPSRSAVAMAVAPVADAELHVGGEVADAGIDQVADGEATQLADALLESTDQAAEQALGQGSDHASGLSSGLPSGQAASPTATAETSTANQSAANQSAANQSAANKIDVANAAKAQAPVTHEVHAVPERSARAEGAQDVLRASGKMTTNPAQAPDQAGMHGTHTVGASAQSPTGVSSDSLGAPFDAGVPGAVMAATTLRRVMEAIEAADRRPPPNTMAVELPGETGAERLRLIITVRNGAVHITGGGPGQDQGGSQAQDGLPQEWRQPLADALAERGMTLSGFGANGQQQRGTREAPLPGAKISANAVAGQRAANRVHDGALRL